MSQQSVSFVSQPGHGIRPVFGPFAIQAESFEQKKSERGYLEINASKSQVSKQAYAIRVLFFMPHFAGLCFCSFFVCLRCFHVFSSILGLQVAGHVRRQRVICSLMTTVGADQICHDVREKNRWVEFGLDLLENSPHRQQKDVAMANLNS